MTKSPTRTREVHLLRRPNGLPRLDDFAVVEIELPPLADNEVLVRNTALSVDPYMRGRMSPEHSDPYPLNAALSGRAVGVVIASRDARLPEGSIVRHRHGWREHSTVPLSEIETIGTEADPDAYLGPLGMPGLTAYAGLLRAVTVREGDVVYISAAAGAVGLTAGRIARHLGATSVIGSAGGPVKAERLVKEFGFDVAIDHRRGDLLGQLRVAAPHGLDVYLDNVGGDHLQAALDVAKPRAEFALCGWISQYNAPRGSRLIAGNLDEVVTKRLSLQGYTVGEHLDLLPEWTSLAASWLRDGSLPLALTASEGIESAAEAFIGLFHGLNVGKTIVRL